MGAQKSTLSEEQLDEYVQLSYLTKSTILHIYKKLSTTESCNLEANLLYRFTKEEILNQFPELRHNPYSDQIFKIFSSEKDDQLSFEDVIDLCSVFSEQCPLKVKASWAFKIFDFDEDNQISKEDVFETINRLTHPLLLFKHEKERIADVLLEEMDLQHTGSMSQMEFVHAITKMPEFALVFSFKA